MLFLCFVFASTASVLRVRAVRWVGVAGQHVVVHVYGGAVVDGIA